MAEPLTLAEEIAILAEARDLAVANRNYWQAECDTIQAKTIEDASEALLNKRDSLPSGHKNRLGLELAASIVRALAQTDESKTEIEK